MIKALIFDFDGLILETESPVYQSWRELYEAYGCQISPIHWAKLIGTGDWAFDPLEEIEQQSGCKLERAALSAARRQREMELIDLQSARPGVESYLKDAKRLGLKVGLASSSSCEWVTGHLSRLGLLEYFDIVNASDDVRFTKPDPELYLLTLEALGASTDQAIVFEDSPNGVMAARRAGLFTVAVPNEMTRQLDLSQASLQLDSLADLPLEALLRKVNGASG
jgi:HAD superfamily hydrolase (TIGR01549 family)